MKKGIKLFLLIMLIFAGCQMDAYAQQSRYDVITLYPSAFNRTSFYFGEHLQFLYVLQNHSKEQKYYWVRFFGLNTFMRLYDNSSGELIGDSNELWESFEGQRSHHHAFNAPQKEASFGPDFSMIFPVRLGMEVSGLEQADAAELYRIACFYEYLRVLPVGSYRIEVEFYLLPSREKIVASQDFSVIDLPAGEKKAYIDFIVATRYANDNHFYGTKEYASVHPASYENFLKKHPESAFSQYALTNLVNDIYGYYLTGVDAAARKEYLKKYYLTDFVKLPNLQFNKIKALANGKRRFEEIGIAPREVIEKQLLLLKGVDPLISKEIILLAKEYHRLTGLKNYACDQD